MAIARNFPSYACWRCTSLAWQALHGALTASKSDVEPALPAANSSDMQQFNRLLEALKQPYQRQAQYQELPAAHWRNYRTFCGT